MVYYVLVLVADVMYGTMFLFTKKFQEKMGTALSSSLTYSLVSYSFIALIMLLLKAVFSVWGGLSLTGVLIALAMAAGNQISIICAIRAMKYVNLSTYSVYLMLGGMLLPAVFGIVRYGEPVTPGKIVCLILILVALLLTVEGKTENKKAYLYYAVLFILNGMSGVWSKLHEESPDPVHPMDLMLLISIFVAIFSSVLLFIVRTKGKKNNETFPKIIPSAYGCCFGYGTLQGAAQVISFIALSHIDASIQYPLITGGVMIISTVIGFLNGEKPTLRNLLSVGVAFIAVVFLIL